MIRLHVDAPLGSGAEILLGPEASHYLLRVMRATTGERVRLFNGRDGEWEAELADAGRRGARLEARERVRDQPPPSPLELLLALVKRARLDLIVEKAVELGVGRVRLLLTERTNADHANLARLVAIAREAAEQTGRLDVPEISAPVRLSAHLEGRPPGPLVYCDEAGDDETRPWGGETGRAGPALPQLLALRRGTPLSVLVGPEGGFSPAERERLRAHPEVVRVSLGPRILRADTAAIAALTLVQAAAGDWDGP